LVEPSVVSGGIDPSPVLLRRYHRPRDRDASRVELPLAGQSGHQAGEPELTITAEENAEFILVEAA
jgi:hypothetical protein